MAITPAMIEEMLERLFLKHRESMVQEIIKAVTPPVVAPAAAAPATPRYSMEDIHTFYLWAARRAEWDGPYYINRRGDVMGDDLCWRGRYNGTYIKKVEEPELSTDCLVLEKELRNWVPPATPGGLATLVAPVTPAASVSVPPATTPAATPAVAPAAPTPAPDPSTHPKGIKYNTRYFWEITYSLWYHGDRVTIPTEYKKYMHLEGAFLGAYMEQYDIDGLFEKDEDGEMNEYHKVCDLIDYFPNWSTISEKWKRVFQTYSWTETDHIRLLDTLYWAERQECFRVLL
jgi:hypothetical protein